MSSQQVGDVGACATMTTKHCMMLQQAFELPAFARAKSKRCMNTVVADGGNSGLGER